MGGWKVVADLDLCQGHQMCQGEAPEIFDFDDDADKTVLLQERPDDALKAKAQRAVIYCPAMALSIVDTQTASSIEGE